MALPKKAKRRIGFSWDHNTPYTTNAERSVIESMRESGRLSFFKIKLCAAVDCEGDVPLIATKLWCSRKCYEAAQPTEEKDSWPE